MAKSAIRYRKMEGRHGSMVIQETGRCLAADIDGIEGGTCRHYELAAIPHAAGLIIKPLDGVTPSAVNIALYGAGAVTYSCVKVGAVVNPFAPQQGANGAFAGNYVYTYEITWQQVGGVA